MMHIIYVLILCILSCYPWSGESATYTGQNAADAGLILDNSQGKRGFSFNNPAHPREHSSTPNAPANYPCVENYSRTSGQQKSGFDSRDIQNEVAHRALQNVKVVAAMRILNQYNKTNRKSIKYRRQAVRLSANDLNLPDPNLTGGSWTNGVKQQSFSIRGAVIVLQHIRGKESTPTAPVHVQTFYPN